MFKKYNNGYYSQSMTTADLLTIRVNSEKQTVENQRFEINNFCKREDIVIDGWIPVILQSLCV